MLAAAAGGREARLWCPAPADIVGAVNASAWRRMYAPNNGTRPYQLFSMRFRHLRATYIKNWKAASTTLWDFLPLLLHHDTRTSFSKPTRVRCLPAVMGRFSFE